MKEIHSTEQSFVEKLKFLVTFYEEVKKVKSSHKELQEKAALAFGNIEALYGLHTQILEQMIKIDSQSIGKTAKKRCKKKKKRLTCFAN